MHRTPPSVVVYFAPTHQKHCPCLHYSRRYYQMIQRWDLLVAAGQVVQINLGRLRAVSWYRTPIVRKRWSLQSFDFAGNLARATPRIKVSIDEHASGKENNTDMKPGM